MDPSESCPYAVDPKGYDADEHYRMPSRARKQSKLMIKREQKVNNAIRRLNRLFQVISTLIQKAVASTEELDGQKSTRYSSPNCSSKDKKGEMIRAHIETRSEIFGGVDGEVGQKGTIQERIARMRELRRVPSPGSGVVQEKHTQESSGDTALASLVAELQNAVAALKEESAAQKQEIIALRQHVTAFQSANVDLRSKVAALEIIKNPSTIVGSKDANTHKDEDSDFEADYEEKRSIEDREDFRQSQYNSLKELIENNHDELYMTIGDNKKEIMRKLATKFQKRLDVVSGDLAEHVAQLAELKESGAVLDAQGLNQQIDELWKAISRGTQPEFDSESNMNTLGMAAELKAFQQKIIGDFKTFAGEVDKELKRMRMDLGGQPVTDAKCKEMEAYLARIEAKMENVQQWVASVNQKLVESGNTRLVGPHY
ncbi:hypothetical protein FKW77_007412 [Venturia effusa]|uniref:Uncharacterized protein n=1 Tax=Venturia effusa TaxID=50376 RepID=A0A517LB53_9PEZI|nr:hypothetical protein FKW77_007412 [Venturia effusa]